MEMANILFRQKEPDDRLQAPIELYGLMQVGSFLIES